MRRLIAWLQARSFNSDALGSLKIKYALLYISLLLGLGLILRYVLYGCLNC